MNRIKRESKRRAYQLVRLGLRPREKAACNLRRRLYKLIKLKGARRVPRSEMTGCTREQLIAHIESRFSVGMSWANYGKWHIDHIRPCATFDLTDGEQVKACFHFTNLRPLWAAENISKGAAWGGQYLMAV